MKTIRSTTGDGFLAWRAGSGLSVEIYDIQVHSNVRRNGVGREMVNILIDSHVPAGTVKVYAITRATNRIAQQFYEALNFRAIPLYDFYDDAGTIDALMYVRDLRSKA